MSVIQFTTEYLHECLAEISKQLAARMDIRTEKLERRVEKLEKRMDDVNDRAKE